MELIIYLVMAVMIFMRLYFSFGRIDSDVDGGESRYVEATVENIDHGQRLFSIPTYLNTVEQTKIKEIMDADNNFDVTSFVEGAKNAFDMVFKAYISHDISSIESFVAPHLAKQLKQKVDKIDYNSKNKSILISILPQIKSVNLANDVATITVDFSTTQIRYIEDMSGKVISGDPKNIITVNDLWVLQRNIKSDNPNWQLVSMG